MSGETLGELLAKMQSAVATIDPDAIAELERSRARFEKLAHEYNGTAGVLRRRAARQPDAKRAAEILASASRFEERAKIMRAAAAAPATIAPPIARMPRALRTPAESLDLVDDFRRELAALVDGYSDMGADELEAFGAALPQLYPWAEPPPLAMLRAMLMHWALKLGRHRTTGEFAPFVDPRIFSGPAPSDGERPERTIKHEDPSK
jgi:hypothetical protein